MELEIKDLGITQYQDVYQKMQDYVNAATNETKSALWFTQHEPVYTLGYKKDASNILSDVPYVQTDRGGDITFHGPGQLLIYPVLNTRAAKIKFSDLVHGLLDIIVDFLTEKGIQCSKDPQNPGVYVANKKIAAVGLRIKNGWSYHGLCLNLDVDLAHFKPIRACGLDIEQVNLSSLIDNLSIKSIQEELILKFKEKFNYN